MLNKDFVQEMVDFIEASRPDKDSIAKLKMKLAKKYSIKKIPTDIELLMNLSEEQTVKVEKFLVTKPVRTASGVAVVAIMGKPYKCPHGKCIYCPGGLDSEFGDVPQSYTGHEPSTMRGIRNDYDSYLQVMNRIEQYVVIGQNPEKIDLILMGGTFPFFPEEYQVDFVRNAFKAMNDFSDLFYQNGEIDIDKFKEYFNLPGKRDDPERMLVIKEKLLKLKMENVISLEEEHRRNEDSYIKCIGLTIETKPDYGLKEHGLLMLKLGCTRVELGIQSVYDKALKLCNRGHDSATSIKSIRELRDLGFKLNMHLMPGLPSVTEEEERKGLKEIFENPDYRPDMIKIYPTMVFKFTGLYELYKKGLYKPLETTKAAEIIAEFMNIVPRYCRVMRVQRDIPTGLAEDGVKRNNLRQYIDKIMDEKGYVCDDIRAREIGLKIKEHDENVILDPELRVIEYEASNGKEYFISADDKKTDSLLGFCRLRIQSEKLAPEATDKTAFVRELHVYGKTVSIGKVGHIQHTGFGKQLMARAEEIAKSEGIDKIIVISGVGVRKYYEKLGYHHEGPYMVKNI